MDKVAVLGGGSWGTALAYRLVSKNIPTSMYIRNLDQIKEIKETKSYDKYLKDFIYPDDLQLENDLYRAIEGANFIISAVPTNSSRDIFEKLRGNIESDTIIVNVAKGIEVSTHMRISQIAKEILSENAFVSLSGPTHAEEVVLDHPTSIVSSSDNIDSAKKVQNLFMSEYFRVYTNEDLIGVEIAGALKNIIALGAGILVGQGYGDNSMAALMTRGINEIARLGMDQGAKASTFFGLAGIGDLIVTCGSEHSRNRRCGQYIGMGYSVEESIQKVGMVVEGIKTARAARELFEDSPVEKPIIDGVNEIINESISVEELTYKLMSRAKKDEMEGIIYE